MYMHYIYSNALLMIDPKHVVMTENGQDGNVEIIT